jgi:hypothetical protein
MGIKLKTCADCGQRKWIGRSKRRCKACRKTNPNKYVQIHPPKRKTPKKHTRMTIEPFENWRVCHLPKCVYPPNKKYSRMNLGKKQRNFVLKAYGYENYATYLRSELWASIRAKVLKNARCVCGCGQRANQVHHKVYSEANILGVTLDGLVAINRGCHYEIEFSEEQKVSLSETNFKLKKRQHKSN